VSTAIVWFRRDLRLTDNPALDRAVRSHDTIIPLYVHAPDEESPWEPGAASCWWLDRSLEALDVDLRARGSRLAIRRGPTFDALRTAAREHAVCAVYWNRLYDPAVKIRDTRIKEGLRADGISVWSGNGALLFEPWTVLNGAGRPYRVFSPFWKTCRQRLSFQDLSPAPTKIKSPPPTGADLERETLGLAPTIPWDTGMRETWVPGESGARDQLEQFTSACLKDYVRGRDRPALSQTSRLSPHLHFGEVGPRQIASAVLSLSAVTPGLEEAAEKYLSEIGWREFAHHLLFHFPDLPERPLDERFEAFPWRGSAESDLIAWQRGRTGIPIVDAGMRELWHTGWMHNRVRMIVGSFLTKNLRIPWQYGARWFWETLVDADLASNTFGWQWIAGCGADAAPYFRVFNPVRQSEKFDADGGYVRRWVPEIGNLSGTHLYAPWTCPDQELTGAGIHLGETYPKPLVDLAVSRKQALDAYQSIRASLGKL